MPDDIITKIWSDPGLPQPPGHTPDSCLQRVLGERAGMNAHCLQGCCMQQEDTLAMGIAGDLPGRASLMVRLPSSCLDPSTQKCPLCAFSSIVALDIKIHGRCLLFHHRKLR